MKTIPTTFRSDGFDFRQLKREGDVAMFVKGKPTHTRESYEVVIVQIVPTKTICGREVLEHEAMPSASDWGVQGWSYMELSAANKRFFSLQDAVSRRRSQPNGAFSAVTGAIGANTAESGGEA